MICLPYNTRVLYRQDSKSSIAFKANDSYDAGIARFSEINRRERGY